jgi:TP901 family phage tail tape measure protein
MAQTYDRRINLYINGKEVRNDIASIRKEFYKNTNELARMTVGSEEYNKKLREVGQLKGILDNHTKAIREASSATKENAGFLGNLQGKLEAMPGAFGSMAAGIISVGKAAMAFFLTPVGAIIGIIAAIGMGVKSLITNSVEFGKAASSLSAITGAVGKDLDFLKKQAREISKESTQSATEMLKAFQTIGGAMPALLKNGPLLAEVTKNAVALSESSGGQLSVTEAAKAAAAALNQFNIPLTESARAVNVLAAGSLEGAAEVDNITESLKNLGPVASGANMSLENTVAGIEILAEKGLLGAEAGTKLRGVILKLQNESLGYASGQFNLRDAMDEANKALETQGSAMEKDAYLLKLFGIENVTAGKIMLENAEKYSQLTEAVTGTNTAFEQARIQQDNLAGSNNKFKEAWKNLMLSIEDGNGILSRAWKGIVDAGTWLLNGITSQFENFGASIRAVGIVFVNFYEQMKTPTAALGRLLKAVFTMDFADMKPALDAFKTSFADIGKDGSLNLSKIAIEQLKLGQASKAATAELKRQKEELEEMNAVDGIAAESEKARKAREEAFKKAQEAFDQAATEEKNLLKQKLLDKKLTQRQYNLEMYSLELAHLIAMKKLRESFAQETATADAQILDKKIEGQNLLNKQLEDAEKLYNEVKNNTAKESQKQEEDVLKDMGQAWDDYSKNKDEQTQKEIEDNLKKQKAAEDLRDMQIRSAVETGMAAVENAETLEEAGKAVINSIREQIRAYLAEFVVTAALKALKGIPFPFNMIAATVAGGAASLLFNKIVPKFATGGYTHGEAMYIAGEAGREWIAPNDMINHPVTGPIIAALENMRNSKLSPAAIKTFASGGFTASSASASAFPSSSASAFPSAGGGLDAATARELTEALNRFANKKLTVYTELIKKDLDTLDDINKKRGL